MARLRITDPNDERLADYVRLRETSLRRSLESEAGLFIAEGALVIRRAIEAGHRPRSFLLAERCSTASPTCLIAGPTCRSTWSAKGWPRQ